MRCSGLSTGSVQNGSVEAGDGPRRLSVAANSMKSNDSGPQKATDRCALYVELPGDMAATDFKQLLAGRVRLENLYVERTTVRTDRGDGIETDGGVVTGDKPTPSTGEQHECITVVEYNEKAEKHGRTPGELAVHSGIKRRVCYRDEDKEGFVKVGEAVAVIELNQPLRDDEITEWCNTAVGKLVLAHWFDHVDPEDVVSR